jgi:hypothetical protein
LTDLLTRKTKRTDSRRVKAVFAVLAACCLSAGVSAQEQDIVSLDVDWDSGVVTIDVQRSLPRGVSNLPAAVSRTRREVANEAIELVSHELRKLQYDSLRTVEELLGEDPRALQQLLAVSRKARVVDSKASVDLRSVVVTFQLDLYEDVTNGFVNHDRPVETVGTLGWVPTDEYSGILVFAGGELEVHGETGVALLEPALFPGIYYVTEDGAGVERLMEAGYVDPDYLAAWGPVMYSENVMLAEFTNRVGPNPLRIIAYGAFGRYPTDVVIRYEDALQILSTEHNRALITEGRVAFVTNEGGL